VRADARAVAEHDAPSKMQPMSMTTSRPQASEPRRSKRAGSAIVVPARMKRLGEPALHDALDVRELRAVVDAARVALVGRDDRVDRHAVGDRRADDVGQVVLVLRVVRRQLRDPRGEQGGRRREHAGVDLVDRALGGRGIAFLDDALHAARAVAHDAAEARRIRRSRGEQREMAARRALGERVQKRRRNERGVAVDDDGDAVARQLRERDAHRVAGPARRVLAHEGEAGRLKLALDVFGAVADDHRDRDRLDRARGVEHVRQHRPTGDRVQHLRAAERMRVPWPAAITTT
jgi:hypothetical protein